MNLFYILSIGVILSLSTLEIASADRGQNFDTVLIGIEEGNTVYKWISHYDRIWNGQSWVNYITTETTDKVILESANIIYKFDKDSCSFSLFNPITKTTSIESFSHDLTINGLDVILSSCIIESINPTNDWLLLKVKRTTNGGELNTTYQVNAYGMMEWTHEIKNTDLFQVATFGVKEICTNCEPTKTDGDLIFLGDYTLDTKNQIHNTLKTINVTKDLTLTYETKPINFFEPVIIDPSFSSNNPSQDGYVEDTVNDDDCADGSAKQTGTAKSAPELQPTTNGQDCQLPYFEWDITSIPDGSGVTDTVFKFEVIDINSVRNCDYVKLTSQPSVASAATVMSGILTGTVYVNNDSVCTTIATNKSIDLGSTADTEVQNRLVSNWFALGVKPDSTVMDTVYHRTAIKFEESPTPTPPPTLEISYYTPNVIVTTNVNNVGDVAKVTGTARVTSDNTNIDISKFMVNGTTYNTNNTDQSGTPPFYVNLGPFWYRMTTNSVYNFTIQTTIVSPVSTIANKSSVLITREYGPQYLTAEVPSQGKYNYTFNDGLFKVNRNVTGVINETWQIECFFQNWALVAFNSTSGDWFNHTNVGYDLEQAPDINPNFNYLISCYNDDLLFSDTVYTDGPLALLGIGSLDATYASYLGVPVGVLFIVMAASLASQRNAPIWIVIILAIAGVMATIGFFTIEPLVWALALIAGLLGLFVGRKLF
jgi:hypothetical protein